MIVGGNMKFNELSEYRQIEIVESSIVDDWFQFTIEELEEELEQSGFSQTDIEFSGWHNQGDGASFTSKNLDVSLFLKKHWDEMDYQSDQLTNWEEEMKFAGDTLLGLGFSAEDTGAIRPAIHSVLEMNVDLFSASVFRRDSRHVHERSTLLDFELEEYSVCLDPKDRDLEDATFTEEDDKEISEFSEYLEPWINKWIINKNKEIYSRLYKEYNDMFDELMIQFKDENADW